MIRFTTPTHEHKVKGIDLTGCEVWVSYEQGLAEVNAKGAVEYDGADSIVTVSLRQRETARFHKGKVSVQINWVYPNGKRDATEIKQLDMLDNLFERELK